MGYRIRTSLLLPLWRQVCGSSTFLHLLLAIRDPQEVMVSLMKRDRAYTGMDAWRAQQLWWRHNTQVFMDRGVALTGGELQQLVRSKNG